MLVGEQVCFDGATLCHLAFSSDLFRMT